MRKLFASVLLLFLAYSPLLAWGGLMSGQHGVRCVSTRWFDIIFSDESERSAEVLFLHADSILESVRGELGIRDIPPFRMPVVVTAASDEFNAWYTDYNYNHIVIVDAVPPEDIAVFSDTVLGTFRHELMHAVSINMRNGFWRAVDGIFGDLVNWGCYVTMPMLLKEGAAVASESKDGGGRLGDGFFLHAARQAKLQGTFPRIMDVTGARDSFPGSSLPYAFGGPFTAWLQETYGMEAYARFWYTAVNMQALTYSQAFRKAYGRKMGDVWREFEESVQCPPIPSDPEELPFVSAVEGVPDGFFTAAVFSPLGLLSADSYDGSLSLMRLRPDGSLSAPERLWTRLGLKGASVSPDGKFIAVSQQDYLSESAVSAVFVCAYEDGSFVRVPVDGAYAASFVTLGERTLLLVLGGAEGSPEVTLCGLGRAKGGAAEVSVLRTMALSGGLTLYSPCPAGEGRAAFLCRKDGIWCLLLLSLADGSARVFPLPLEGMSVRSLGFVSSAGESVTLSFSWATAHTFPRLGTVTLEGEDADYSLMETDVSGGIYAPCAAGDGSFIYAADFVTRRSLYALDAGSLPFSRHRTQGSPPEPVAAGERPASSGESSLLSGAVPWREPYWHRGTLLPFTNIPLRTPDGGTSSRILFPGVTWMTNTPWDSDSFAVGAGVSPGGGFLSFVQPEDFAAAVFADWSGGSETGIFSYDVWASAVFGSGGFVQSSAEAVVQSVFRSGEAVSLTVQDGAFFHAASGSLSFTDSVLLRLSAMSQSGLGTYAQRGVSVQYTLSASAEVPLLQGALPSVSLRGVPALIVRLPRLIPIRCAESLTYNLPLRAQVMLFPSDTVPLDVQLDAVLFSWDIQKGLPFFPLYFNRLTVSAGYELYLLRSGGGEVLQDMVNVDVIVQPSVNTGAAAYSSGFFTLGASFRWYPRNGGDEPWTVSLVTSFTF